MSYTMLKTSITVHDRKGSKVIKFKNQDSDHALGLLKSSAFRKTTYAELEKCFLQLNYEHEVHCFVEKLLSGLGAIENEETGEITAYIFEDKEVFTERHLLWACFEFLIKADLTICEIKHERMELLHQLAKAKSPILTSPIGDIPIDSKGTRKAVDEISKLRAEVEMLKNEVSKNNG